MPALFVWVVVRGRRKRWGMSVLFKGAKGWKGVRLLPGVGGSGVKGAGRV